LLGTNREGTGAVGQRRRNNEWRLLCKGEDNNPKKITGGKREPGKSKKRREKGGTILPKSSATHFEG